MESLYPIYSAIGEASLIVYFFALIVVVHRYRLINSTIICIGLVFMMQSLMRLLREPLMEFGSREVWYGSWTIFYVLTAYMLYKTHDVLKVNLAQLTNRVAFTFCIGACIHTARYIDRQHFGGAYLDTFYPLAINTINVSLAAMVMITVAKDKKERLVGLYV